MGWGRVWCMQGKSEQDLAICNSETYLYTIIDCVMDKMTPEQRHHCMSSIRSKNTKPEMVVRRYLFSRGFRFRVNVKRLPGTPDICTPQVSYGDIRERMFLAWARGMQILCTSQK